MIESQRPARTTNRNDDTRDNDHGRRKTDDDSVIVTTGTTDTTDATASTRTTTTAKDGRMDSAVEALATRGNRETYAEIADRAGVSRITLWRYLRCPLFRQRVAARRAELEREKWESHPDNVAAGKLIKLGSDFYLHARRTLTPDEKKEFRELAAQFGKAIRRKDRTSRRTRGIITRSVVQATMANVIDEAIPDNAGIERLFAEVDAEAGAVEAVTVAVAVDNDNVTGSDDTHGDGKGNDDTHNNDTGNVESITNATADADDFTFELI